MTDNVGLGSVLGSYRIESVIGGSWMSAVYRARHVRLGTPAALKVLAPGAGQGEAGKRFLRDIGVAAELEHPNIVPILDAGMQGDVPYVVTRLVAGGDLKTLISRAGALPPEVVAAILRPVADALDAAHRRWLVHGDVRPSNVLVEWSPGGAVKRVYLADFGMAGAVSMQVASRSLDGTRADRFDYLAPEQRHGGGAMSASDVFGLGCVLYHAITGRAPFAGALGGAAPWGPQVDGPVPPSRARRDLPTTLDDPVLRAVAAEADARFESCSALVGAFEAALEPGERIERADLMLAPTVVDGQPLEAAAPPAMAPAAPPPPAAAPPAEPPASPAKPPASTVEPPPPSVDDGPAVEPPPRERRRHVATAVIVVLTLLAGVAGYAASTASRGGGGSGSPAGATARAAAAPAGPNLRAIIARDLPDFTCKVNPGPAGGSVAETAACAPTKAGTPPIRRVALTRLTTRTALNRRYADTRARSGDPAARRPGDCRPNHPWAGSGRWFDNRARTVAAAGSMFCTTARAGSGAGPQPRIVWTVGASRVLAEASAPRSADLGAWWQRTRNLDGR
ncbi:MAG: serine/threonine-protein kinase [Solirubrobacteraceae bacterium]